MFSLLAACLLTMLLMAAGAANRIRQSAGRADAACLAAEAARAEQAARDQQHAGMYAQERTVQGLLALVFLMVDAPVAIVTVKVGDDGGRILMTNPAFDRLVGYRSGVLTGRKAMQTVEAADRDRVKQALALQDASGRNFTMDLGLVHATGAPVPALLTFSLPAAPELRRFRLIVVGGRDKACGQATAHAADYVVAGKIRMISLADVRSLLGDEWEAMAGRILTMARSVIDAHVGPQDTVRAASDLSFVIVFADMSEAEANARCTFIGREIRRTLIQAGEDAPSVEVASTAIQVTAPASEAKLDAGFAAVQAPNLRKPVQVPGCGFMPVQGCRRGEFVGWFVSFDTQTLSAESPAGFLPPRLADRNRRVLTAVARQAHRADSLQSAEELFTEVDFASFGSRADADGLVEACTRLDPAARARLMLLLSGVPAGVPNSRLADVAIRLAPLCQTVGFALGDLEPPAFDLALFKAPLVSVDAAAWGSVVPEARVGRLLQAVHLKRARLLVRRAADMDVARQMRALGVDLVSCQDEAAT